MAQTTVRTRWRRMLVLLVATSGAALAWVSRKRGISGERELVWSDSPPVSLPGSVETAAADVDSAPPAEPDPVPDEWWEPEPTAPLAQPEPAQPEPAARPAQPEPAQPEPAARPAQPEPANASAAKAKPDKAVKPPKPVKPAKPAADAEPAKSAKPAAPTPAAGPQTLFDNDGGVEPGPFPNSVLPLADGSAPSPEYLVKGNAGSMKSHSPTSPYFSRTRAEVWFRTEEDAVAAGFRPWTRKV